MSLDAHEPTTLDYASKRRTRSWVFEWVLLLVAPTGLLVLAVAMVFSFLSQPRSRGRSPCAANLKGIATVCLLYSEANQGQLPPSLDVLLEGGEKAYVQQERLLVCPEGGHRYVYIPGQTNTMDPRNVLVYEPLGYHDGKGANMGFLDGHAMWKRNGGYWEALALTAKNLVGQDGGK